MSITILYGCCQVETSVPDLDAARRMMVEVLGAGPIEQALAQEIDTIIPDPTYKVDHLDCGEATFQLNQPSPSNLYLGQVPVHQAYLARIGACVTNLNFFIDDHAHAHALLAGMGAETHIKGPSSAATLLGDYGPENTRPGGAERPFMFMGARHLIGLDLEIMEPNFLRFVEQKVQNPCFLQPRPEAGEKNILFQRMKIVVEDLDATYENILKLFTPGSRSKPYALRQGRLGKAFRIGIGGIEIEYCAPVESSGPLAASLSCFGPGVVAVEFDAFDPWLIEQRAITAGLQVTDAPDFLGLGAAGRLLPMRAVTGFDVVLGKRDGRNLPF